MSFRGYVSPDSRERFSLTRFIDGQAASHYAVYVDEDGSIRLKPTEPVGAEMEVAA